MDSNAVAKMQELRGKFRRTGLIFGILSGFMYGVYSTFVTVAGQQEPLLSAAAFVLAVTFITCGINDFIAGIWLLIWNFKNGKSAELSRSVKTFPGKMIILGALVGGPIANGAYIMGLSLAGVAAIPISATCALFGAIFAWIFLKQKPTMRVVFGMIICVAGAVIINLAEPEGATNFTAGIICAFVAAICWGIEGMISSFGGSMLDSDVAVNIRELVSGGVILVLIIPAVRFIETGSQGLFLQTLTSVSPMMWLTISGLSAAVSYLAWYKANSTVGTAIGMSLNVTYALWGVVLAVIFLGTPPTATMIVGSIVIVLGAIIVTMNPLDFFRKGDAQ